MLKTVPHFATADSVARIRVQQRFPLCRRVCVHGRVAGERTLVAVAEGLGRYAVKYVYWPLDEMPEMEALAEHVFDSQGAVLCCYCAARGDSPTSEREGATRRSAARWSYSDRATARAARPAGAKRDSPVAYNPNH